MDRQGNQQDLVPRECPLCDMSTGRTSRCAVVYRNDRVMATIDNRPVNPGHTLVYPRAHFDRLFDLDAELYHQVLDLARAIAGSIEELFRPTRVALLASGLEIAHAHVHLIPVYDVSDLTTKTRADNRPPSPDPGVLSMQARMISIDLARKDRLG